MTIIIAFAFDAHQLERLEFAFKKDDFTLLPLSNVNELVSAFNAKTIDALLIGNLADDNLVQAVQVIITSTLSRQSLPILMVGAYQGADIARMLNLGIDDYINLEMNTSVVGARLRSHLRRIEMQGQPNEEVPIVLNIPHHQLSINGTTVHITQSEFNILLFLATHPDIWHSSSDIFKNLWQKKAKARDDALVRNHIRNLRRRLEAYPELVDLISTRQGRGYMISKSIIIQ